MARLLHSFSPADHSLSSNAVVFDVRMAGKYRREPWTRIRAMISRVVPLPPARSGTHVDFNQRNPQAYPSPPKTVWHVGDIIYNSSKRCWSFFPPARPSGQLLRAENSTVLSNQSGVLFLFA